MVYIAPLSRLLFRRLAPSYSSFLLFTLGLTMFLTVPHIDTATPPAWFTPLPSDVQSNLVSQQSVMEDVVTSVLKISSTSTATSSGGAAQQTVAVAAGGAVMAGMVGVLAML